MEKKVKTKTPLSSPFSCVSLPLLFNIFSLKLGLPLVSSSSFCSQKRLWLDFDFYSNEVQKIVQKMNWAKKRSEPWDRKTHSLCLTLKNLKCPSFFKKYPDIWDSIQKRFVIKAPLLVSTLVLYLIGSKVRQRFRLSHTQGKKIKRYYNVA